nr:asparagine synthase (glutamine-hydrolyzing) [Candidatus Omnitrophota bacterium]
MCGIAGVFNYKSKEKIDPGVLSRMRSVISHRGPDEDGFYINQEESLGLGHRRLSIIDIKTGQQPMSNHDKSIWIVFNGEIYNFQELKEDLQKKGHHFNTRSDTEVIIYMYQEYGEEGFKRLNGIFSFGIYDIRKHCLILTRDYFGVKPLYYIDMNGALVFGSEIKVILQHPHVKKEMDHEAFNSFLTFRYNPSPQTLFKGIRKLLPGYCLKITAGGAAKISPYCNYIPATDSNISEREAIEEYRRLLEQAVKRQMISDVPVGLLLSGGVDSAAIGYLMQKNSKEKTRTFSIGFSGSGDFNELALARRSAEMIGSEHYSIELTQKEYMDFFFKSFYYMEEPIAETTVSALHCVSKLAAQHLKVVLTGQGADELLAGYPKYVGENYIAKFYNLLRILPLASIAALLPRNERLRRAVYASKFPTELQRFLAIYTIFTPEQKMQMVNGDIKKQMTNADERLIDRLYSQASNLKDSLSKMMFIDARMSLSDNLLLFNDKMTMANSLEMRVPFLDLELARFLESLPSEFKLKAGIVKYIHKRALEKWLPAELIYRKKRGFETPMDKWLQSDLADAAIDILNAKNSACNKYFILPYINKMIEDHRSRKRNFQRQIFALLSFELWYKNFFENEKIILP